MGRKPMGPRPMSDAERQLRRREKAKLQEVERTRQFLAMEQALEQIATRVTSAREAKEIATSVLPT